MAILFISQHNAKVMVMYRLALHLNRAMPSTDFNPGIARNNGHSNEKFYLYKTVIDINHNVKV